jgi:hypothetical protein
VAAASLLSASARGQGVAHAQGLTFEDPYDVPTAPRPPTLPELTHSEIEATLETTAGALVPTPGGPPRHAYVQRLGVEVPLGLRRWFVGATYELAAGGANGSSFDLVGGNLMLDGRTLWATKTGLAFGGGLGLALPTASFDDRGPAGKVALDAATLRPWDVSFFVPNVFGLRPFVDVRAIDGRFVVQFRQGLDITLPIASPTDRRLYATAGVYLGWRVTGEAAWGLEVFEAYAIDAPGVTDGSRAVIVASPNVRLTLPWVQPAISMFTGIGKQLYGTTDSVWGFRVALTLVVPKS